MKKILVPVDFSEVSELAAQFAIELAELRDSEVIFLNSAHVDYFHDYQYSTFSNVKSLMDDVYNSMQERMKKFENQFDTRVSITGKVSQTSLLTAIKEEIDEQGADILVMGTSGCSGLEEVFIGSNTERVVRNVSCPVISLPVSKEVKDVKKILVPLDLREIRSSFLEKVAAMQKLFSCDLEFLWVKTPHNIENEEVVGKELSKIFAEKGITDFQFFVTNNVFPSDGILIEAHESKADMIAMATHARRGIAHWLSGSMTEDTVNHVDVPVWSFRIDKNEKPLKLNSTENLKGKPEYRKLEVID